MYVLFRTNITTFTAQSNRIFQHHTPHILYRTLFLSAMLFISFFRVNAQIKVRPAPEKQNYASHRKSYNDRILKKEYSGQTDSLLRDFWYRRSTRSQEVADSLHSLLTKRLNISTLMFYADREIKTQYVTHKRFSVNGMLADSSGNIVIQTALEGIGEMRTYPALTEKTTQIDWQTAQHINPECRLGDTLILPPLQLERTTLKRVKAVVSQMEMQGCLIAGQNVLSALKLTFDHQFFNYAAEPADVAPAREPNLYLGDYAYLGGHDGAGNFRLYAIEFNRACSRVCKTGCSSFYMEDVHVDLAVNNSEDLPLRNSPFQTCGILGTDLLKNRKVILELKRGSIRVFPRKNILPDGIYAVAGTAGQNESLSQSMIEVVERAPEFIRPGESSKPKEIAVFTHDFVPLGLEAAPDEIAEEGKTVAIRLYFSEPFTGKLERFTADFTGGNIALIIAGRAVTMQPVYGAVKNLKSVDVTQCTPAAARYLHLHLQNN
mgnify:CR=1 FL=1